MRYLIIGLGIYGSNLARDLTDMGHEVIGADDVKANVEAVKDYISTVYLIDATEESSLALLPLNNVDVVIVAIGENFGASIKVVALLKKLKVKHIYARAIDDLHRSILTSFQIDRILTPEQRAAFDLTHEMGLGAKVQCLQVDDAHYVLKFSVPEQFVGLKYSELDLERTFRLRLIAATGLVERTNLLGIKHSEPACIDLADPDATVGAGDTITCYGAKRDYYSLLKHINEI